MALQKICLLLDQRLLGELFNVFIFLGEKFRRAKIICGVQF